MHSSHIFLLSTEHFAARFLPFSSVYATLIPVGIIGIKPPTLQSESPVILLKGILSVLAPKRPPTNIRFVSVRKKFEASSECVSR